MVPVSFKVKFTSRLNLYRYTNVNGIPALFEAISFWYNEPDFYTVTLIVRVDSKRIVE